MRRTGGKHRVLPAPEHAPADAFSRHSFRTAVVLLCAAAVWIAAVSLKNEPFDYSTAVRAIVVLTISLAFDLVSARVQSLRRRLTGRPIANVSSVWTFCGAMVLPPGQVSVLVAALALRNWFSAPEHNLVRIYRFLVTWSAVMISAQAASGTLRFLKPKLESIPSGLVIATTTIAALIIYFVLAAVVMFGMRYLVVRPAPLRSVLPSREDVGLEISTLCLGGLTAICLLYQPWLMPLVLAPMAVMQRSALVKQLEEAARTDAKTGLLNVGTWEQVAERELVRAEREHSRLAVLILDLDYFKSVNDRHGHLAGDAALVDVAKCLLRELRPYDVVGRFGGEEFVALLPGVDLRGAEGAAERIRRRIGMLAVNPGGPSVDTEPTTTHTLSASIGVAVYPGHGTDLPTLLHQADAALYAAKRAGRNRVAVAGQVLRATPRIAQH